MQKTNTKIAYLDGLRGLAALLVFFHHFFLAFYSAYYNWDANASHLNGWDIKYGKSAFSVLTNGNFFVCVFFILSGFVLSHKYFNNNKISILISAAQRRFLRLYIPVAFTLVLSYLLIKAHFYFNAPVSVLAHSEWWFGGMWLFSHPTKALLSDLFCNTMFFGDASFDTSMWTMNLEFYFSFVVFAFLALTTSKRRFPLLMVMLMFCYFANNAYLGGFILGISINYVEGRKVGLKKYTGYLLVIVLLALGLLLGSYPSNNIPGSTIFAFVTPGLYDFASQWFHIIGAFFLVLSFILSPGLQRFISLGFFRFLGYISFSIYLVHPLVIGSFSSYLFLYLYKILSYNQSVMLVLFSTTLLCFLVSWLMTRYVDDKGILLSKYIYSKYLKDDTSQTD